LPRSAAAPRPPARERREELVSVVVPTRDRLAPLRDCLDALSAQTIADRLDIVVVDDGSVAAESVRDLVAEYPAARLLRGSGGGPAGARNAGARAAKGTLLCFTDDDCSPRPDWAERLVEALQEGAEAVAGVTLSGGGALADASEIVAHAPSVVEDGGDTLTFAPSNNLACTRRLVELIEFDESYPGAAGEDRDWSARLRAAGYALRLEPAAVIVHRQDLTFGGFLRQQIRYGQGAYRFRRTGGEHRRLESADFYIALVRRGFSHGFGVGSLVAAAQLATGVGFIGGWLAAALLPHFRIRMEMSHEGDWQGGGRREAVGDVEGNTDGREREATSP
jgi:GT2 family glycosyltransferase